jgi:predicted deacylase
MAQPKSRIWTKLDFEKDGKQVGYLHLPHSVDRSGAGTIAIPCAVFRNGAGPSSLLMAGNHGDEFEGQVALTRLIRDLEAEDITGRVIIVPAINLPAAMAGTRISPIDDRNLNRCFPGNPNGTPTEQIAYYIETELVPLCESWLDLHSGGASMAFMPYAQIILSRDEALNKRALAALEAFGAPLSLIQAFSDEPNMSNGAATRNNAIHFGTEAGGSGTVSPDGVRLCYEGTLRSLVHLGHLSARNRRIAIAPRPKKVRWIEIASRDYYTYAPQAGLFEPVVKLGDMVKKGQIYGYVQFVDDPLREPAEVRFEASGLVVCMRHPGRCERGDCLGHLASDIKR